MYHPQLNWKTAGLLACAIVLTTTLHAQTSLPSVALLATDPAALEGTSGGSFTLVRHGDISADLPVTVTVSGTAVNGVDYSMLSSTVLIPAGYYAVDIPVQPLLDTTNRGNKTVVLTLQASGDYTHRGNPKATVRIVDDVFNIPPPTISITSPSDGSAFAPGTAITLQTDVVDSQLPVKSVNFYADDKLLGKVTSSPYTFVWTPERDGSYTVFARAVDEFGKSSLSAPVDVTVSDKPVVTLFAPEGGTLSIQGQIFPLEAQIGAANEAISSVSFYANGKLLGTVTQAPFVFNWQTTKLGTFQIQAVATDAKTGKKGDSNVLQIDVISGGGA